MPQKMASKSAAAAVVSSHVNFARTITHKENTQLLLPISHGANQQEWTKIYQGLGLGKETTSQLQAFRARHTTALNKNAALKSTTPEIDLSHYKSILKDQSAVQNAEKVLREFKPVDYDLSKWNGVVDAFEGKAVSLVQCGRRRHRGRTSAL